VRIGLIGVASIGHPMAGQLLAAGHQLIVHDRRPEPAAGLLNAGAVWAASPAEVAAQCDLVATCLPGPPEMEAVCFGAQGLVAAMPAGGLYVDHTTNSPMLVRHVHEVLATKGVAMVDAPVSGGTEGARTRDLLVMAGGDPAALARARPELDAIAARVLHTGGIGSGTVAKLMHNCAVFSLDLVMAECWTVAVKAGVAPETIVRVFTEAALGRMTNLTVRLPATYLRGNFEPRFALELAHKDLSLALELARSTEIPLRLGALCKQEMGEAIARGWSNRDASIFLTLQEERAGVQVRLPED